MSRNPNYADVVTGTVGRVLEQGGYATYPMFNPCVEETILTQYIPEYHMQDDFTVALLIRVDGGQTRVLGVSKRNAEDAKSPLRGKSLAVSRAVRKLALQLIKEIQQEALPPIEEIRAGASTLMLPPSRIQA